MFAYPHSGAEGQNLWEGSALNPDFEWPEMSQPVPAFFFEEPDSSSEWYFTFQTRIINQIQAYKETVEAGSQLLGLIDQEISRREQEMIRLSLQCLTEAGVPAAIPAYDQEKFIRFHIFLVTGFNIGAHDAAALIAENLLLLLTYTNNGDTLATLSRVISTAQPLLPDAVIRQRVLKFIVQYLPHNMPSINKRASLEVPIVQSYAVPMSNIPYPFIDEDKTKRAMFEKLIRPAIAQHQAQAEIVVREANTLSSEELHEIGKLRGDFFGNGMGWQVPEIDIDRHDNQPYTSHIELIIGPEDSHGYCRRLRIHPQQLLDLANNPHPDITEITEVLRSLDVMPFPQQYYELDTDVREIAKTVPKLEGIVSNVDLEYDAHTHYPGTTEQVAETIDNYLANPQPEADPILDRFISMLAGTEAAKLNIIERLIPPAFKIKTASALKPVLGTSAMVVIMGEVAAEAFRRHETLWLFQTDKDFKQHLELMFGASAVRTIAHISQVKRDVKQDELHYVRDDCFTMLIDIHQALHNVLDADSSPEGYGEFVLGLIAERDPILADELRDEWINLRSAPAPASLAITTQTAYHKVVES